MDIQEAYKLMAEASGLEVGDTVKVLRKFKNKEGGCIPCFNDEMAQTIGYEGKVTRITKDMSMLVNFGYGNWFYPFFVLEKIKDGVQLPESFAINDEQSVDFKEDGNISVGCQNIKWKIVKKIYETAKSTRT